MKPRRSNFLRSQDGLGRWREGATGSALSDIETGKTEGRLSILQRIAGVLDLSLDDLIPATGRHSDEAPTGV
jgi:transcriptional regulator with XRE-family HTH domain